MIFVIVGLSSYTTKYRVLESMDRIAGRLKLNVVFQIGNSSYVPRNGRSFRYVSREVAEKLIRKSRIVVTDGGFGTILRSLKCQKLVIVMPRPGRNYFVDVALALQSRNLIHVVDNDKALSQCILRLSERKVRTAAKDSAARREQLIKFLHDYLQKLS
jgi:UDP-N-acetylglucosamine transferase subunit ALG13